MYATTTTDVHLTPRVQVTAQRVKWQLYVYQSTVTDPVVQWQLYVYLSTLTDPVVQ